MGIFGRVMGNRPTLSKDSVVAHESSPVSRLTHPDNTAVLTIVPITNGFLVTRRVYNSNGPDHIEARFVATADQIGTEVIALMAVTRITK